MRGSSAALRTAVNRGPPPAGVRAPVHHAYRNPGLNLSQDEIPIWSCTNSAAFRTSESIRTSPPHPVGIALRYAHVAGVPGSNPSTRNGRHVIPPFRRRSYHHPPTVYSPPTFTSCSRPARRPRPVQARVNPRLDGADPVRNTAF